MTIKRLDAMDDINIKHDAIDDYFECITACSLSDEGIHCLTACIDIHLKKEARHPVFGPLF